MVKMVYGDQSIIEEVMNLNPTILYLVNESQTSCLKNLEAIAESHILIVTDPELMRGFDYRSSVGIELLIATSFEHQRAFE